MISRCLAVFGAVLLATASAQTYGGGGLGKTTYSVSDSFGCAQWLLALLPTEPDLPNGAVPCGKVGRVRVATSPPPTGTCTLFSGQIGLGAATDVNVPLASCVPSSGPKPSQDFCSVTVGFQAEGTPMGGPATATVPAATPDACCKACRAAAACTGATYRPGVPARAQSPAATLNGFGLHTVAVNDTTSPRIAGKVTNVDVENTLDLVLFKVLHGSGYDAFLDFSSGHWVASLDPYTDMFDSMGMNYARLQWADGPGAGTGRTYYSIVIRVHTSMMLLELMSETCKACTAMSPKQGAHTMVMKTARYHFPQGATPESVFGALDDATAPRPLLHPARVSWPTSDLDRDRKLFVDARLVNVVAQEQAESGSVRTDTYDFTTLGGSGGNMQLQLVQRPPTNTSGTMSIAAFEQAMLAAHQQAMVSDVCGFDQWLDNHIAVSALPVDAKGTVKGNWTIGKLQATAVKLGLKYHVLQGEQSERATDATNSVYLSAPNGLALQVNGLPDGSYTPSLPPSNGTVNLCSMGTCAHRTRTQFLP